MLTSIIRAATGVVTTASPGKMQYAWKKRVVANGASPACAVQATPADWRIDAQTVNGEDHEYGVVAFCAGIGPARHATAGPRPCPHAFRARRRGACESETAGARRTAFRDESA